MAISRGGVARVRDRSRLTRYNLVKPEDDPESPFEEVTYPEWVITDHRHKLKKLGTSAFNGPDCATCGENNNRHLSWGQYIVDRVDQGGDPMDYIARDKEIPRIMDQE
jgi:hypothetical protein